jgi:integrase
VRATTELRFLALDEVDLLVAHARPGMFQDIDRALFRTAAMTGLRKGELVALRWSDVDWSAGRIRVRQNYVRGEFGTPKSKRSTRSVPMADDVAGVLERLFQSTSWQADDDLVFAHPVTGGVVAKANVTRRMRAALEAAGLSPAHRSMICATRSARGWRPAASHCARCRSGSGIGIWRRRRSTRTMRRARGRLRWSRLRSRGVAFAVAI